MLLIKTLAKQAHIAPKDFLYIVNQLIEVTTNKKVAVAVSGGSDSLCLVLLLNKVLSPYNIKVEGLVVNHNLRAEAEAEAAQTTLWLKNHNIKATILYREPKALYSKLQEQARIDRYLLLLNYCKEHGIKYLFTAHTLNDALETMIMREKRGKNILGAAGISMKIMREGVNIVRPFLYYTKRAVINTLKGFQNEWIEDPSNFNFKFERVKVREEINKLSPKELQIYINKLISNLEKRLALEQSLQEFIKNEVIISAFGEISLKKERLLQLHTDLQLLVMGNLLKLCGASSYLPKLVKLENLIKRLSNSNNCKTTLGNVLINIKGENIILIKEGRHTEIIKTSALQSYLWDQRFIISGKALNENCIIKALTFKEYDKLLAYNPELKQELKDLNLYKALVLSLPWRFNAKNQADAKWIKQLQNKEIVTFKPKSDIKSNLFFDFGLAK